MAVREGRTSIGAPYNLRLAVHLRSASLMKSTFAIALGAAALLASALVAADARAEDAKAGDKAAGATKAQMCIGCHGIPDYKASFPAVYRVPKIGGQNEKYLLTALGEYKKGDRKHPTMHAVAATLTDQDMADLAAYYASEGDKGDAAETAAANVSGPAAELLKRGNCSSCHGANFAKPIDPSYPKLAGQHPDYLYEALVAYQTDRNPSIGRNNPIMMGMARPFTHPELKLIADYLSSLPSELRTNTQSRFR